MLGRDTKKVDEETKLTRGKEVKLKVRIPEFIRQYGEELARAFRDSRVSNYMFDAVAGFTPVPGHKLATFIVDNRKQIMSLKAEYDGEESFEYFGLIGCVGADSNNHTRKIALSKGWVEANFTAGYLETVRDIGKNANNKMDHRRFVPVPAGADRENPDPPVDACLLTRLPEIEYQQSLGERTCLISSISSAFHWLGFPDEAARIFKHSYNHHEDPHQIKKVHEFIRKEFPGLNSQKLKGGFDVLDLNNLTPYPRMVTLVAKDGGCEHAVTIVGGLIFDSTFEHAIPLSRTCLDWCCINGFHGIRNGYEFFEPKNQKKRKKFNLTLQETVFQDYSQRVETVIRSGIHSQITDTMVSPRNFGPTTKKLKSGRESSFHVEDLGSRFNRCAISESE